MWLYLALISVLAVYLLVKRTFSFWDRNEVPSIPGIFFVGSIWDVVTLKKHFGLLAHEWYQKFSNLPYFGYYNGSTPVLMIRDLDIIKDVLIKDFNSFSVNEFQINVDLDPLLTGNPFFVSGEQWKMNRSLMSPQFSSNKVKTVFPLMVTTCTKLQEYLNVHGSEDLQSRELAAKFTTENSVMCGFTFNAESFTNSSAEFRVIGRNLYEQSTLNAIKFMILVSFPWWAKQLRISVIPKYIDTFYKEFYKSNIASRANVPADDILQMLLHTAETKKIPVNEVIGHSFSFFAEGFETSSGILSHSMFELSRNSDVQDKVFNEVISILAEFNNEFCFDAIQKMEYLDAILDETMRMYPVLLSMHKICTVPYEFRPLPGEQIGYKMPKGGAVAIPVHAIHRDPEYYPDPEVFNPDRFLPEQRKTIPKGAFLGLGEGPRICVGMRFGQVQIKAALATIVKSFRIKLSPVTKPYKIDPGFWLNGPLDPILLNFEKRYNL